MSKRKRTDLIFDQVIGHKKSLDGLRLALKRRTLSNQALLFCGPSGVGFAQGILCQDPNSPCGKCGICIRVASLSHPDLMLLDPGDNATIKIDQIRDVQNFVSLKSFEGQGKVVIIDEAQSMTLQASNGLLKTLEEPPPQTYFVLITSNRGAIIPTIQSRTRRVLFGALSEVELKLVSPELEPWVYSVSQGRAELALKYSDKEYKSLREKSMSFLNSLGSLNFSDGFKQVSDFSSDKETALFATQCWGQAIKKAVLKKLNSTGNDDITQDRLSDLFSTSSLLKLSQKIQKLEVDILSNVNKTLAFETFFIEAQSLKG
jgi:DNA polymerase-3 subunit delta'